MKKPDSMRQSFKASIEKAQNASIFDQSSSQSTSVDDMVEQFNNDRIDLPDSKDEKNDKLAPQKEAKTEYKLPEGFKLEIKSKEKRTVSKSFALSEAINQKFAAMATKCGVSENELLNTILGQIFAAESD